MTASSLRRRDLFQALRHCLPLPNESKPDLEAIRSEMVAVLKPCIALSEARITAQFNKTRRHGRPGLSNVQARSRFYDRILLALYEALTDRGIFGKMEDMPSLLATGGYGRAELAPHSDLDLLFLMPDPVTNTAKEAVSFLLYVLWDLDLKLGHTAATIDEAITAAKDDITIATALTEMRFIAGSRPRSQKLQARFERDVMMAQTRWTVAEFTAAKLVERDARHQKLGDSRYILEPNIKEGKGGLRDLHSLLWIARYAFRVDTLEALVNKGIFTRKEYSRFNAAHDFLLSIRCRLHELAGRAEDRLTFDLQPAIARSFDYQDRGNLSGTERFMRHYFLHARMAGDLTRILCAALEHGVQRPSLPNPLRLIFGDTLLQGFAVRVDLLAPRSAAHFRCEPVDMIRLFRVMQQQETMEIHPDAFRAISANLAQIDRDFRAHPEANALFRAILTAPEALELPLRRMHESGLLGRFIPDFERITAMMQYDMYHHFTVDEHTLRALGILHDLEQGKLQEIMPLPSRIMEDIGLSPALHLAIFCHDLAKGRKGDHTILGEPVTKRLGKRLGFAAEEIEMACWLVRHHLDMSMIAHQRDLTDPQAICDFVALVQTPQRLKLLYLLTCIDIHAVGPGRYTRWKGGLLQQLYESSHNMLTGASPQPISRQTMAEYLRPFLPAWPEQKLQQVLQTLPDDLLAGFTAESLAHLLELIAETEEQSQPLGLKTRTDHKHHITELSICTADRPGLFSALTASVTLSGANILEARIFTLTTGQVLDVFLIQTEGGTSFDDPHALARLSVYMQRVAEDADLLFQEMAKRDCTLPRRYAQFRITPELSVDNSASATHSLIEITARDRPGLLHDMAQLLHAAGLNINAAKISTFGAQAVDVFYVQTAAGAKLTDQTEIAALRASLMQSFSASTPDGAKRA